MAKTKEQLRIDMQQKRSEISAQYAANAANIVAGLLKEIIPSGLKIGGYFAIRNELNIEPALKILRKDSLIALPIAYANRQMKFYEWDENEPLFPDKFGIFCPQPNKLIIPDILIVPMLAFDKNRFRLGYGGGFYDMLISQLKPKIKTIGVAYSFQAIDNLPVQAHDEPLDMIVTENGVL